MKLFLIIYNAAGLVGGVIGPLDKKICTEFAQEATVKIRARPDVEQLTFRCEWRKEKPEVKE